MNWKFKWFLFGNSFFSLLSYSILIEAYTQKKENPAKKIDDYETGIWGKIKVLDGRNTSETNDTF